MKKILTTILFGLGVLQFTFAQEIDPALLKKIALESCECFPSDVEKAQETMNSDESRDCVAEKVFQYRKALDVHTELEDDEFTPDISMDLLDKVTMDLLPLWAKSCPAFFNFMLYSFEKRASDLDRFAEEMSTEPAVTEELVEETPTEEEYIVRGKIKELKTDQYAFVVIVDEDGQEHEVLWMYHSAILEDFKANKGKEVIVYWYEDELYNSKQQDYSIYKVIQWIELAN